MSNNPLIRSTYLLQMLTSVAATITIIFIIVSWYDRNYLSVIINIAVLIIQSHIFISQIKARKRLTKGFSKYESCSCGSKDWGTLIRQYDEVPICRNCWKTWQGEV